MRFVFGRGKCIVIATNTPTLKITLKNRYVVRCICLLVFGYDAAAAAIPLGVAAFFAALTRLPLTSTVLSCEITGALQLANGNLIFPVLVASIVGARAAGFWSEHTVFERMMTQDGRFF